jgi:tetratricopeptide (TPR) repeat protein
MALPEEKVARYTTETVDPTRPLSNERAEVILFDLKRDLRNVRGQRIKGEIHHLMGFIYGRLGQHQEALEHLRAADSFLPFRAVRTANISTALVAVGQFKEAVKEALRGLKRLPSEPKREALPLYLSLATSLFVIGLTTEAEEAFEEAEAGALADSPEDNFRLARQAALLGSTPKTLLYFARFGCLAQGIPVDDSRASEIALDIPWHPSWSETVPEVERVLLVHAAYVSERERLRTTPTAEPTEEEIEAAETEEARVFEEMQQLRARANAVVLAEVEEHGPA